MFIHFVNGFHPENIHNFYGIHPKFKCQSSYSVMKFIHFSTEIIQIQAKNHPKYVVVAAGEPQLARAIAYKKGLKRGVKVLHPPIPSRSVRGGAKRQANSSQVSPG